MGPTRSDRLMMSCTGSFLALIYLIRYGAYGLWDPWESHYGEVAREVVARGDWISLWWAHEQWFWSKPVFIFWTEALSLLLLGVRTLPGEASMHLEWAIRLPHVVLSLTALGVVMQTMRAIWGTRVGVWTGWVLGTVPVFAMIGHQAITDMPFVSTMVMAMCMFMRAWCAEDRLSANRVWQWRAYAFKLPTARHIAIVLLTITCVPQILYWISRNVVIDLTVFPFTIMFRADSFMLGSANNPHVPGNPTHTWMAPYWDSFVFQPGIQAIAWALGYALALFYWLREKLERASWLALFYIFCAWSFMAKGLPGLVLPALVIFFFLWVSGQFQRVFRGDFFIGRGLLTVAVMGGPWVTAMHIRHGPAFLDRLLIHDHINRLAAGVHGDTGSVRYFIQQLGVGMFPWIVMLPCAVWALVRMQSQLFQRQMLALLGVWFAVAFTLFSLMITKFHHYIFPAVPPLAILIGIGVSCLWERRTLASRAAIGTGIGAIVLTTFVGRDIAWKTLKRPWGFERFLHLFTYLYDRPWPEHLDYSRTLSVFVTVSWISVGIWTLSHFWPRRVSWGPRLGLAAFSLNAGVLCAWLLQVYMPEISPHWSQRQLVRRYYRLRKSSSEPLVAWQMNWKGENIYTGNRVYTFVDVNNVEFLKWVARHPGKRIFVILEHERLRSLKSVLSPRLVQERSWARDNNKFVLVSACL